MPPAGGCDSLQQQTGGLYGEVVERVACAVPPNGTHAGTLNLHLVGHPHTGTNWMKHLVSTMLYLASNFDTHPFFAAMASDRVATWNVTFHSMFYDGRFKHDIPHWPEPADGYFGAGGLYKDRTSLSSAAAPCVGLGWRGVRERCVAPAAAALQLPLRTPTRWLLTMRNPVNLCVSNAEMGHKADAVFDVCDRQIGTLATAVIVRHLWHSEVLPREATTTWWYEDDAVAQCRGLLAFLGYRANLGVLCDAAVSLNSRATMAEVMGLARRDEPRARRARDGPVAARVVHHGVRTLDDPIAAALSVRQAANLTQRFWPRLPPLLQSKWRGALREYLEFVL